MELSSEIKKLEPGESHIIEILDENGFSKISPWGLSIPPLRLTCEKFHNAKRLSWFDSMAVYYAVRLGGGNRWKKSK